MSADRRQFLKFVTSGAVTAGVLGSPAAGARVINGGDRDRGITRTGPSVVAQSSGASFLGSVQARGATPGSVTDPEERRRLIG